MVVYFFNVVQHIAEVLPHFVILSFFCVTCLLIGQSLLKRFLPSLREEYVLWIVSCFLLGTLFLAEVIFLLGVMHLLYKPIVITITLLFFLLVFLDNQPELRGAWLKLLSRPKVSLPPVSTLTAVSLFFLLGVFLYSFIKATLPDDGFDSNWYHLTEPFLYLRQHSLKVIPGGALSYSAMPQLTEMLYLILLSVGNSVTTSLFSTVIYFLLVGIVYQLTQELVPKNKPLSFLAAAIVAGVPLIIDQASVAYIDTFLTLIQITAWCFFLKILSAKVNPSQAGRYFLVIGVLTGFALGVKLLSGIFALLLGVLLVFDLLFNPRPTSWPRKTAWLIYFAMPAVLVFMPWAVRSYLATGNPVAPHFNSLFLGDQTGLVNNIDYATFLAQNPLTKIYRVVFWLPRKLQGGVTLFLLLPLLFFLPLKKRPTVGYVLLYIILFTFLWYFIPPHVHRYLMPVFPLVISLAMLSLATLGRKVKELPIALGVLLLVANFLQFADYYYHKQKFFYYLPYALGLKTSTEFKAQRFVAEPYMFYDYDGSVKKIVQTDKLLTLGVPLLYPTLENFDAYEITFSGLDLASIETVTDLKNQMRRKGFRFALTIRAPLPTIFAEIMHRNLTVRPWPQDFVLRKKDLKGSGYYLYELNK